MEAQDEALIRLEFTNNGDGQTNIVTFVNWDEWPTIINEMRLTRPMLKSFLNQLVERIFDVTESIN